MCVHFHILTLFPQMVSDCLHVSILGRAQEKGLIEVRAIDIRAFTENRHRKVDDYPYGGGAGMLLQAQPVYDACQSVMQRLRECGRRPARVLYMTPQGRPFCQEMARQLAREEDLIFLCGHYEGVDQRVLEEIVTDPVSLGDFVLTGGELPAMAMADAIARMVPGVLSNGESKETESFCGGLLEYPQYSRPRVWRGKPVPQVLLSGDHGRVDAWRLGQSLERTARMRPDLFEKYGRRDRAMAFLRTRGLAGLDMFWALESGSAEAVSAGEASSGEGSAAPFAGDSPPAGSAEKAYVATPSLHSPPGVLLREKTGVRRTYWLDAPDADAVERLLSLVETENVGQLVSHVAYAACSVGRRWAWGGVEECKLALYLRKTPPLGGKDLPGLSFQTEGDSSERREADSSERREVDSSESREGNSSESREGDFAEPGRKAVRAFLRKTDAGGEAACGETGGGDSAGASGGRFLAGGILLSDSGEIGPVWVTEAAMEKGIASALGRAILRQAVSMQLACSRRPFSYLPVSDREALERAVDVGMRVSEGAAADVWRLSR